MSSRHFINAFLMLGILHSTMTACLLSEQREERDVHYTNPTVGGALNDNIPLNQLSASSDSLLSLYLCIVGSGEQQVSLQACAEGNQLEEELKVYRFNAEGRAAIFACVRENDYIDFQLSPVTCEIGSTELLIFYLEVSPKDVRLPTLSVGTDVLGNRVLFSGEAILENTSVLGYLAD